MDKQQEANQAVDSISSVGVPVKDYAPSEVYSSEPPPAYVRPRANAVQIARIAAVTLVAVSFILGFFMLASAYISATATCSYGPEYPQQEAEDRPTFQHLVDPLESEETTQAKRESLVLPPQDDQEKPVQIKLPLQLDFDEIAGSMMERNQRSRMNCVVEKRRAEEVMDHQPKTVRLPFGVNLTTDPRYEHITGERMAIFCESGNDQRHVPAEQQLTPIMVPVPIHHPVPVPQMMPQQMHQQMPQQMMPQQMHQQMPQQIPQQMHHMRPPMPPQMHPAQLQQLAQMHQARMMQPPQPQMMQPPQPQMMEQPPQHQMVHPLQPQMLHRSQAPVFHHPQAQMIHQQPPPQPHMMHQEHPPMHIHLQQMQPPHPQPAASEEQPVHIIREEHIIPIFQVIDKMEGEDTPIPADTVKPPPPPPYHRLPLHIREQIRVKEQQPVQMEQQTRPHYVQPRSVRSVDEVFHRREKRVRRCACDCSC